MKQWMIDLLLFNRDSIALAVVIAAVTGPVFAATHEAGLVAIRHIRQWRSKRRK